MAKWDIKKKNENYWQITPAQDPEHIWLCALILFFILIIAKFPDRIIDLFK